MRCLSPSAPKDKARDKDTDPKKPTARAANRHFVVHGRVKPVATLTFVRKGP